MNDAELNNKTINELIIKLVNLNTKLNSKDKSNIQLVLTGHGEDERDYIIENLMADKDFINFTEIQAKKMAHYYGINVDDFRLIVITLLNVLMKDYKLIANNITNPKGHLLSYCFKQPIGKGKKKFPNRIWGIHT